MRIHSLTGKLVLAFCWLSVSGAGVGCSGDDGKNSSPGVPGAAAPDSAPNATAPGTTDRHSPAALARSRERIDSLESGIKEAVKSPTKAPDIKLAMYTIQAYQYFAADFPTDPRAPEALDRAAQLYSGVLNDHERAVEYYEKAYQKYPQYKNRPQMLLQQAIACEQAQDTAAAAIAYKRLLTTYPDHELAKEARGLLKLLRMSDEQKAKAFK